MEALHRTAGYPSIYLIKIPAGFCVVSRKRSTGDNVNSKGAFQGNDCYLQGKNYVTLVALQNSVFLGEPRQKS